MKGEGIPPSPFIFGGIMRESKFQSNLICEIRERFQGSIVIKIDASVVHYQGIPDLLILYQDKWAALECKGFEGAHHQPNQDYYVSMMNEMSFAAFIYPENKEEVLNEMEQAFRFGR